MLLTTSVPTAKSPIATLGTKHIMNYSREHTVAEGLAYTTVWNMVSLSQLILLRSPSLTTFSRSRCSKLRISPLPSLRQSSSLALSEHS